MAVVAFSDFSAILESTGDACGIAGAALIGLSVERPSFALCCRWLWAVTLSWRRWKRPTGSASLKGLAPNLYLKNWRQELHQLPTHPLPPEKSRSAVSSFFSPDRESSLVTGVPAIIAAVKLAEW